MRGLLLKDFYVMRKQLKMHFVMDLLFIAIMLFNSDNILFGAMPVMLGGAVPITLLAYDERSRWSEYCGALPYSGAQVVSAKYLIGLITQTATTLVVFAALLICGGSRVRNLEGLTFALTAAFAVSLIMPAICMPFCLRFGTEKGRLIYYMVIAAIAGTAVLVFGDTEGVPDFTGSSDFLSAMIIVIPILYALSWLLSVFLYGNKKPA
ncbi:MAG: ABC-2 transporter permease [Ruminococcus sp.]|nr:ABC-2 transporter permease [Ruminococcus sp.]